jgi:hypothetical protein
VGRRSDQEPVGKREICFLCRESNSDCLLTQLTARSLPNSLPSPAFVPVLEGREGAAYRQSLLFPSYSGFSGLTLTQRGFQNICIVIRLNPSRSRAVFSRRTVRISEGTPIVTEVSPCKCWDCTFSKPTTCGRCAVPLESVSHDVTDSTLQ